MGRDPIPCTPVAEHPSFQEPDAPAFSADPDGRVPAHLVILVDEVHMNDPMESLLVLACALLASALYIVRMLTKELPQRLHRNWWYMLGGLILLFLCGYVALVVSKYGSRYSATEMLVATIFFLGAVFVLLVCQLTYRTTRELKRICFLEQETITDPLLGISNRRCLDRRLQEEVLRARRHKLDLSLLMVDIDHFKRVNDTWGHQIGDLVLQHMAQLILGVLRQTDILARFGGEEFVILLPHTPEPEAYKLAERLRHTIEQTPLLMAAGNGRLPELYATVSIGSACLRPDEEDDASSLLERGDKAMYRAKQEGRNRVVRCLARAMAEHGEILNPVPDA
jgi:diguanylate cyclase (GGDEF)-like protein